jgi:hypothetical protein
MDSLYGPLVINLDKRKDRLNEVTIEFEKLNLKFKRIPASTGNGNGILGCLESHCICLEEFLQTNEETLMVCEDDAVFKCNREELDHHIKEFLSDKAHVLCLGFVARTDEPYSKIFLRSRQVQTTVCYVVKRVTAVTLLETWRKLILLIKEGGHKNPDNWLRKGLNQIQGLATIWNIYCADQAWKLIQQDHIFVIPRKPLVIQRASFSDIEKRFVSYDA